MKKLLKKTGVILGLLLFAILLSGVKRPAVVLGASEEDQKKGSITLQLTGDARDVELTLWKVADYKDGKYIFSNGFENSGVTITNLKDASEAQGAADALTTYAIENNIKAADTQKVDKNGRLLFSNLSPALYLAGETSGDDIMKVQGVLVPIPYLGENGLGIYDAEISPKYSFPGGAVLVHKVDEEGSFVSQAEFVLQQKVYITGYEELPENVQKESDQGGEFYWKEFAASLVSDKNGQIVITDMPKGTYRVIETKTPAGYISSSVPYEFVIEKAGEVKTVDGIYQAASGSITEVTVVNNRTQTSVNKVDDKGNYVSGARFVIKNKDKSVITDENGNARFTFTSGAEPYVLKGLPAGDYYLSELEPPKGFTIARDVLFTVSDNADAVNTVTMVDEQEKTAKGKLVVTKQLYDEAGKELQAESGVFYVALFADEDFTDRISRVAALTFEGSSSGSTVFENLEPDKTYYVSETNEYGEVLDAERYKNYSYAPQYPEGQTVELTRKAPEKEFSFNNVFYELPDGYYYKGDILITKNVVRNGEKCNSEDIFYAGIFTDAEHTKLFGEAAVELAMDGNSSVTVDVPVTIGDSKDAVVRYYVTETDKNGVPLENGSDMEFTFTVENGDVQMSYANNKAEVVLTNSFTDITPTPETEITPVVTETPKTPDGGSTPGEQVKTGDDTPVEGYLLMLLAGGAIIALLVVEKKKMK